MPMKNKLLYYALAFYIFSVCSCSCEKTDDDPNSGLWLIDQTVKDYALFKPGTYWVYQDSASGAIDSVYVYNLLTGIDTLHDAHGDITGYFEYFYVYYNHSFDGYSGDYWVSTSWTKMYGNTPIWLERFKSGNYVGQTYLMVYPFDLDKQYGCYTDDLYAVISACNIYSNLFVLGMNFGNGVCYHDTKNVTEGHVSSSYFIAKNFGLVRKEIPDSLKIWNLILEFGRVFITFCAQA